MTQIEKIVENDWEPTTNRFVAFFDIMGFQDLVLRTPSYDLHKKLKDVYEKKSRVEKLNNQSTKSGAKWGETISFTFSDSIIFFSKSNNVEDVNKIILDCKFFLSLMIEAGISIKGSVCHGEITVDKENSIYFGQPIIDAHLLYEDLQLYTVVSHNSFEKQIKELNLNSMNNFEFYKTPLKSGKAYHYLLKPFTKERNAVLENLEKLYLTVSGKPRQYIDNTIEFIKSLERSGK